MRTTWTHAELQDFIDWHESVISQYPTATRLPNGKVVNTQGDLRQDRTKWLGGTPVRG